MIIEVQALIQLQSVVVDFLMHVHRNSDDLHAAWRRTEVLDPLVLRTVDEFADVV